MELSLNKNVTIELTPQQIQVVLIQLRKGAFEIVAPVIAEIEKQILEQLKEK